VRRIRALDLSVARELTGTPGEVLHQAQQRARRLLAEDAEDRARAARLAYVNDRS
jgi:hypothetical protein